MKAFSLFATVLFLTGCATPPGKLTDSDFVIRRIEVAQPTRDVAANFRDGLRYCGSETGIGFVTHHGIPDCGPERSNGSLVCDMYVPQGFGAGRSELVLGIVEFKSLASNSTEVILKVQTFVAKKNAILNAWEKFAEGRHKDICQ